MHSPPSGFGSTICTSDMLMCGGLGVMMRLLVQFLGAECEPLEAKHRSVQAQTGSASHLRRRRGAITPSDNRQAARAT